MIIHLCILLFGYVLFLDPRNLFLAENEIKVSQMSYFGPINSLGTKFLDRINHEKGFLGEFCIQNIPQNVDFG